MRIPSGTTDQYVYFVAVDATDLKTRETGLSSFTVYRSRDGAAAAAMTTPTVNETDATNMPGVYELLLDEDTTIAAGNDSEEMLLHITQAAMSPVSRAVELYRPKITTGRTLTVAATGEADADVIKISGDSSAADNLEATYDGTGYTDDAAPSTQSQVGSLSVGSSAISTTAASFTKVGAEPETNTYTATHELDGTYHIVEDDTGTTDFYYEFSVGGDGIPVEFVWDGYAQGVNDSFAIYAYNWDGTAWEQIGTVDASNGTTPVQIPFTMTIAHVGTGANVGKVRMRVYSTDGSAFATDRVLCSYSVVARSVGYADGAIWVNSAGVVGSELYVNGTADNPCPWTQAKIINASLSLNRFVVATGDTLTLDSSVVNMAFNGYGWTLALGGQDISEASFEGAETVTGTATATASPHFNRCDFGAATLPPGVWHDCGVGKSSGTFTGASAGEYALHNCFSLVPGSGAPSFVFSALGPTTGINNRAWHGGATYTLDSNCTLSHEVPAGGGTSITTGGGDAEVRGMVRSLTLVLSAAETIQFVGVTGPISVSGTTTATVNLYGVADGVTDTSSAAVITDKTVSRENVNIECDTALSDYDGPTNTEMLAAFTEIKGATWASGTDTLEAIRDRGDAAWITATSVTVSDKTGFSLAADQSGVTVGTVNAIAGTIGTLDALDTAQDTQHASTQADIAALNNISVTDVYTTQMTESYAADGVAPTMAQSLFMIQQFLQEKVVSSTTMTVKQLDGSTTAMTFTLDSATAPTSITRAA